MGCKEIKETRGTGTEMLPTELKYIGSNFSSLVYSE